jgi:hypothetical protein
VRQHFDEDRGGEADLRNEKGSSLFLKNKAAISVEKSRSKYPPGIYWMFTIVNENQSMNRDRKQFVTSLLMLGVLAMIFAVLAFAEKTREDGHLPERNGRGSGETTSLVFITSLTGMMIPGFHIMKSGAGSPSGQPTLPLFWGMR